MKIPVSAIIPCYCSAGTIERAFMSVINQTALPYEIIIVDDASNDNDQTKTLLTKLKKQYGHITNIKIIYLEDNQGPSYARNLAWDEATQTYIAFLDADDSWHPSKLEVQFSWMKEHSDAFITGHNCVVKHDDIIFEINADEMIVEKITKIGMLISNRYRTPSVMLRKDIKFRFDEQQRYAEDYYLWLQIILYGYPAYMINLPLAYLYKAPYGEGGLTSHLWQMEIGELRMHWLLYQKDFYGFLQFSLCLVWSLSKYLRRLLLVTLKKLRVNK